MDLILLFEKQNSVGEIETEKKARAWRATPLPLQSNLPANTNHQRLAMVRAPVPLAVKCETLYRDLDYSPH